ncbi:class I SAM-dependent RNA methyltransferase [Maricaulaceae bacterium EIL42A08]|nr:class I SAM-dependent RNA methyltransferase [Maricaulaceae bacterium EIL42A08]
MTVLELFFVCPPGLEPQLLKEADRLGFKGLKAIAGGVLAKGDWAEVWRANLMLRGATRVLVRVASFHAKHLSQLDKKASEIAWTAWLARGVSVRVDAVCRKSKIYHSGAAAERVAKAISAVTGGHVDNNADVKVLIRIDHDQCTISIDTSGEPLFKRGHKPAVAKAPIRENLAALFLEASGYDGTEPVLDPMCGSGTFLIEAAEIASRLTPGRDRHFAFEHLPSFKTDKWSALKAEAANAASLASKQFYGFDRDPGAVKAARANVERAGLSDYIDISQRSIAELSVPESPPGLVIVNPPYGGRISNPDALRSLYHTLGQRLKAEFQGWRVGIVTSAPQLAKATRLKLEAGPPVDHGGLMVRLYQTTIAQ